MTAATTAMVGGSFDPVHIGHLHLVHTVACATAYRRFIFVPVAKNNFKQDANPVSAAHRLQMLRLAFGAYSEIYPDDPPLEFIVEDCELKRGGVSYTYDTVRYLYGTYPIKDKLAVVLGDDLLDGLTRWHYYEQLKELVTFVVVRRKSRATEFSDPAADILYLENPRVEESSSLIRKECAALGDDQTLPSHIAALMPKEVALYVQEHRLYRM